jgi:hypothetical protein
MISPGSIDARIAECELIKILVGKSHHMDMKKKDMAYWIDRRIAELQKEKARTPVKLPRSEEWIRESERNGLFSVMRHLGIKFDAKAVVKLRNQWDESAKAEAVRKAKNSG